MERSKMRGYGGASSSEDASAVYDADDEADLVSHVSETTDFADSESDSEVDSDAMSSLRAPDQPLSPIAVEGLGDSALNHPSQNREPVPAAAPNLLNRLRLLQSQLLLPTS